MKFYWLQFASSIVNNDCFDVKFVVKDKTYYVGISGETPPFDFFYNYYSIIPTYRKLK